MKKTMGKKMVIEIDVETGIVGNVYGVTVGEKPEKATSGNIKDLTLLDNEKKPNKFTSISDYTVFRTQSSPGCIWYFYNGIWHRVCS